MAGKFVILLVFLAGAFAGPLSNWNSGSTSCATTCPEGTKFTFEPGKTYEYTYESDLKTSIPGATEEHSSLHMRATVQVEVMSPCEMVLKLSEVSLQDSDPSQYESRSHVERAWDFKRALQEKPLRFGFVDGRLENICPNSEETWVLNVKRGILSGFQNTMYSLENSINTRETDVTGDCPVSYEVKGESWGTRKVKKTKDLLACTDRHGQFSAFQGTPYRVPSKIQSLPLMKSTHECEQEVNTGGLLIQSTCAEQHTFRPFSKEGSGATTSVNYKLVFRRQFDGITTNEESSVTRESLLFNHEQTPEEIAETLRESRDTLAQLCRQTTTDIRPETPGLFAELVRKMRKLDTRSLKQLHNSAKEGTCDKAEKFFHDAVPMLGSTASVVLTRDMITSRELSDAESELWLTSLAFISKPTKEMLQELKPLLDLPKPYRKAALTVSSLVHSYCRDHVECSQDETILAILKVFEDKLRYNCVSEDELQHEMVVMSLKAIGNAGHAERTVPTLNRCFQNTEIPMETRVAALNAFRRMGCEADHAELMNTVMNLREDSEIRINAYLALMSCPSENIINRVRTLLETEEVNQVGSFIWTHLTNLAETSSPHKQSIREILENKEIAKAFDLDKRKFSRNMEWSLFSEMLNTGAMVESNVIFSSESFVPRSAMVNLTVDMFGESMNLLEVGGRVQGMEKMFEKMFGPGGEFDNTVEKRQKRSSDDFNALDSTYDLKRDDPQLSYYLRVFGNELRYDDIHDMDLASVKDKLNYLEWLIELSREHQFEATKSIMFLDSTINIPTAVGMPLRLGVDGTTTVNVAVNGKLDIRKMATYPSTVEIAGSIKPSAAVEIRAEMGIDAHVTRTGLRMVNTLHSSTVADGRISLKESQIFNLDLNLPQDKMEIITAESKFFITHREESRPQQMITEGRKAYSGCIPEGTTKTLGLELCGELSFPYAFKKDSAPWFPLTGPATAKVYLNKKESYRSINVEAKYIQDKKRGANRQWEITDTARLYFNTPGSSEDREMMAEFTLDRANMDAKFELKTPWKTADMQGNVVNTEDLKRISARATLDGNKEYSILSEIQKESKKMADEYKPKVEIVAHGMDTITLDGSVLYRENRKLEIDMKLQNMFRDPVVFKGDIDKVDNRKRNKLSGSVIIKSRMIDAKISGLFDNNKESGSSYAVRFDTVYAVWNGPQQKFTFSNKIRDQSTKSLTQFVTDTAWTTTNWPRYDGDMSIGFSKGKSTFNTNFEAGFDEIRRITIDQTANLVWNRRARTVDGKLTLKFPPKEINYEMGFDHEVKENEIVSNALVKYAENHESKLEMSLVRESIEPLKLSADIKIKVPGREMSLVEKIEEKSPKEYHHTMDLQLAKYQNIRVVSVYKMIPRHELTAEISLPDMEPITFAGHLKPTVLDFQARVQSNYQNREYVADMNWQHSGSPMRYTIRSNTELSCPHRKVLSASVFSREGDVFTINYENKWDANRDGDKKIVLNAEVTALMAAPKISLKTQMWPNMFINIDANGKYATTGWIQTEEDLEGAFSMTSSNPYLEDISANMKYDHGPSNVQTTGEVSWARGQKISTSLTVRGRQEWRNGASSVTINTPFQGFRTMTAESTYALNGLSLTSNNKVSWERNVITMDLKHMPNMEAQSYEGEITVGTPFPGVRTMAASVSHKRTDGKMENVAEASIEDQKFTVVFNNEHNRQGYYLTNNGDISITTPFAKLPRGSITWNHQNNADGIKSHAEIDMSNQKAMFDIDGTHRRTNRKRSVELKARMQLPIPGMEDRSISLSHEHQRTSWNGIKTEINAGQISYNHEFDFDPSKMVGGKIKFTSPFRRFEKVTFKTETKKTDTGYDTEHELKWGANRKMSLDGSFSRLENSAVSSLRVVSPFKYVERLAINTNMNMEGGRIGAHIDAEYGSEYRYVVDYKGEYYRKYAEELSIETPHSAFRTMKVTTSANKSLRNIQANYEFMLNGDTSTLAVTADTTNLDNIIANVELNTAYRAFRFARIGATHTRQGNTFTTGANIELPQYTGNARHEMTVNSAFDFKTMSLITYMPGQSITLTTAFTMGPKIEGSVTFASPFPNMEDLTLSFNHAGRWNNFKSAMEMTKDQRHKINMAVDFMTRDARFIRSSMRFTSPFRAIERVAFAFNHQGGMSNFRNDASFEFNNEKLNGDSEFSIEGNAMRAKASINTPFEALRVGTIELSHDGVLTSFSNDAKVNYNGRAINANSKFAVTSGSIHLDTPFQKVRDIDLSYDHSGPVEEFRNSATASFNGQEIRARSEFSLQTKSGTFHIDTPFNILRNIDLRFSHNGGLTTFTNEATLNFNTQEIKVTGNLNDSPISGTFHFESPLALRSMDLTFNHEGGLTKFSNNANFRYNGRTINANSAFDWEGITGSFHLDTPYNVLRTFDTKFEHKGKNWRNFENSGSVEINGMKYTGDSELRWFGRVLRARATIKTPDEYSIRLNHKGNRFDFSNTAAIRVNKDSISATSLFKLDNGNIIAEAEVETPFKGYGRQGIAFSHTGPIDNFVTKIGTNLPIKAFKKFNGEYTHRGNMNDFQCTLKLDLPFNSVPEITMGLNHRGNVADFTSSGTVEYNGKTITGLVVSKLSRSAYESKATLTTPYPGLEKFGIAASHTGDSSNFKTIASVETPFRPYNRFSAEVTHEGNAYRFTTNGKLETNVRGFERQGFSVSHSADGSRRIESSAEVTTSQSGFDRFEIKVDYVAGRDNIKSSVTIETPFNGFRKNNVNVEHTSGSRGNLMYKGQVSYDEKSYGAALQINLRDNNLRGNIDIDTPHPGFEKFGMSVNHDGTVEAFNSNVELTSRIPGYERIFGSLEKTGSLDNLQVKAKFESTISNLQKFEVTLNHQGDLRSFQTSGSLETSMRQYPRFDFSINHRADRRKILTTTEVNTPFPGFERFAADLNHVNTRQGIKTTANLETPFRGYERLGLRVNHDGALNNFKTAANVNVPQYGNVGFELSHNGDLGQFETVGTLDLPLNSLPRITITLRHAGHLQDFTCTGIAEFNNEQVEGTVAFKKEGGWSQSDYQGRLSLTTPSQYLRDLSIVAAHNRKTGVKTGNLDITYNSEKMVDFDYSYDTENLKNVRITLRQPAPMETEMNIRNPKTMSGDVTLNWDTNAMNKNIRIEFCFKNIAEPDNTDQEFTLKGTTNKRTVGVTIGHVRTPARYFRKAELIWGKSDASRASFEFDLNKSVRRSMYMMDGTVKMNTPVYDFQSTFNHRATPGVQYTTDVIMQTAERLTINNEFLLTRPGFKNTLTVTHPRFNEPATISVEGTMDAGDYNGKVDVQYDRERFTYEGRIADESRGTTMRKVASTRLQHRNSNLDFQWEGSIDGTREAHIISTEAKYLTSQRETKVASLRAEINALRKEISLDVTTPIRTYKLSATKTFTDMENGIHRYTIVGSCDEDSVRAEMQLNKLEKCVEAKVFYNPEDYVHVYAKYMTPSHMQLEAYHTTDGERTSDMLASLALKDGRLVSGRAYVRPTLYNDMVNTNLFSIIQERLYRVMKQVEGAARTEMRYKQASLARAAEPLKSFTASIAQDANRKMEATRQMMNRMYANNEYFSRDIYDGMYQLAMVTSQYASQWMTIVTDSIETRFDAINQQVMIWKMNSVRAISQLMDRMEASIEDYKIRLAVLRQKYSPYVTNAAEIAKAKLMAAVDRLRTHPTFKKYWNMVASLDPTDLYSPVRQMKAYMIKRAGNLKEKYSDQLSQLRKGIMWVNRRPETQQAKEWVKDQIDNSKWLIEYLEIEKQARAYYTKVREGGWDYVKQQIAATVDEYIQFHKNSFSWDAENNDLRFDLFIPVELQDLQTIPRINIKQYLIRLRNVINSVVPEDQDWSVWDYIYRYKPSSDVFNWIPPFKTRAVVAGNQHYMTFDKHFYEFAGECSYLLARDFIDGEFTVMVNYDTVKGQTTKKSITVASKSHQAEIFSDARVIVDGVRMEMPLEFDETSIQRLDNTIRLDNAKGLTVICDLSHDRCTVNVTGWYFGKTAGLFGTFDNEPSNDFTLPDRSIARNPEDMAASWTLGRRCRPVNNAVMVSPTTDNRRYRLCAKYFEETTSPFRPCFRIVDPAPFMKMCMNDMPINVNRIETEEDTCSMGAFYVDECRREGVNLRTPAICVRCETEGGQFIQGDELVLEEEEVPQSADVIFVVQHSDCNKELVNKIQDITQALDKNLKADSMRKNRYAIVGFGGLGVRSEPHVHTMDGQIFNSQDKIVAGLENFQSDAGSNKDILHALRFASNLPFRAGVSKTLVLLPCDKCEEGKVSYPEIQQTLLQRDIRLHVLIQQVFNLKGKQKKAGVIFGADKDGVFTKKSVNDKELEGDKTLARFVQLPKDICVPLTEETDGSVWSSESWLVSRPVVQKQLLDVMVRVIAKKATPTDCQVCECVPDGSGVGKSSCRSCEARNPIYDLLPQFEEEEGEVKIKKTKTGKTRNRQMRMLKTKKRAQIQQES